ncbi:hypothetical protein F5887DRAFT_914777 [Amanita rubescens]|nr:hypothetical protein F5887DRAFT_914777 [Amanita rubescens]
MPVYFLKRRSAYEPLSPRTEIDTIGARIELAVHKRMRIGKLRSRLRCQKQKERKEQEELERALAVSNGGGKFGYQGNGNDFVVPGLPHITFRRPSIAVTWDDEEFAESDSGSVCMRVPLGPVNLVMAQKEEKF